MSFGPVTVTHNKPQEDRNNAMPKQISNKKFFIPPPYVDTASIYANWLKIKQAYLKAGILIWPACYGNIDYKFE
jgi:hypothetical protein